MLPGVCESATEGFNRFGNRGSLVPDALFAAFADDEREITTDDLCNAAKSVVPLSVTAAEKITKLRTWAATRARPASAPRDNHCQQRTARALDLL